MRKLSPKERRMVEQFAKSVAPYYTVFDWHWHTLGKPGDAARIPTVKDIIKEIHDRFKTLMDTSKTSIEAGGITLFVDQGEIRLEFTVVNGACDKDGWHVFDAGKCLGLRDGGRKE